MGLQDTLRIWLEFEGFGIRPKSRLDLMAEEKDPKAVMELDEDSCEEEYSDDEESDHGSSPCESECRFGPLVEALKYCEGNAQETDHTLYVKHFSDAATIQEIMDAFGKYGKIVGIRMKPEDGSCLVNYARPEEAYAAMQALHRVHTLPGGQHPIRVVREVARAIAVGSAESLYRLSMLIKADRERGEFKDIPINAVESGELTVESMSWRIMDNLRGEELLQMADKDTKQKKPQEGGNGKRGKKNNM